MFQEWAVSALGGQARSILSAVFGYLVLKGFITPEQGTTFESDAATRTIQFIGLAVPMVWSAYVKFREKLEALARKQLGPGATDAQVKARALTLGFSDLWNHVTADNETRTRLVTLEARVHDLEAVVMKAGLTAGALVLLAVPAFAQPRIDTAARHALKWHDTQAADGWSNVAVTAAVASPCLLDRHWDCLKNEALRVGTATLGAVVAKFLLPRTRPDGSDEKSFFSQHTSIACAATLRTKVWALCPAVGILRVDADKHWATDVIAGSLVGGLTWTIEW